RRNRPGGTQHVQRPGQHTHPVDPGNGDREVERQLVNTGHEMTPTPRNIEDITRLESSFPHGFTRCSAAMARLKWRQRYRPFHPPSLLSDELHNDDFLIVPVATK